MRPKLLVFDTGNEKIQDDFGLSDLAEASRSGALSATISGVVSNHENGVIRKVAQCEKLPFYHFSEPYDDKRYAEMFNQLSPELILLCGWMLFVKGLPAQKTINIHHGPPEFSGKGMCGIKVHQAVMEAYRAGTIKSSAFYVHFVNEVYDGGKIFFERKVPIESQDVPETLGARVRSEQKQWLPVAINWALSGKLWLGDDGQLNVPFDYDFLPSGVPSAVVGTCEDLYDIV